MSERNWDICSLKSQHNFQSWCHSFWRKNNNNKNPIKQLSGKRGNIMKTTEYLENNC